MVPRLSVRISSVCAPDQASTGGGQAAAPAEYKFYTEFQSHESEFDFLKSLEIEEKINKICWCLPSNGAHFLLSTNGELVRTGSP